MKRLYLVRATELLLVLGVAGAAVGCGPGYPPVSTAEENDAKTEISKKSHQARSAANSPKPGNMRRGKAPSKTAP